MDLPSEALEIKKLVALVAMHFNVEPIDIQLLTAL